MYTQEQVDEMLSQVEQEFEKTLGSITKNEEETEETVEVEAYEEETLNKSEDEAETEVEEEYETIDELYASMDKSEKEAHYASVKKALFGEVEESSESETAEEPIQKSEEDEGEEKMLKSENDELKAQNDELKKNLDQVNELLNKLFNNKKAPEGKAITGANYIAKSEETEEEIEDFSKMKKSEITAKLKGLDYSSLEKSDRDAINEFYLENGSVEKIKHLITK